MGGGGGSGAWVCRVSAYSTARLEDFAMQRGGGGSAGSVASFYVRYCGCLCWNAPYGGAPCFGSHTTWN